MKRGWAWLAAAWVVAFVATLAALFIGEVMGHTPCLLCWYQRIAMFPLALILGMAAYADDRRGAAYARPFAAAGAAIAGYHAALMAGWVPSWWVPCGRVLPQYCPMVPSARLGTAHPASGCSTCARGATTTPRVKPSLRVREVCSAALSLREARNLRVRLPLARLTVAGRDTAALEGYRELIADELNVKEVAFSDDLAAFGRFVLRPNGRVLGPKLGGDVQKVIKAAKDGQWTAAEDGTVAVAGHVLQPGEFELALTAPDGAATAALRGNDAVVNLDTEVTDELRAEGVARDLIRLVQQARKDADLAVTDRISLVLQVPAAVLAAVEAHRATVADAVLATEVRFSDVAQSVPASLDEQPVTFTIAVAG